MFSPTEVAGTVQELYGVLLCQDSDRVRGKSACIGIKPLITSPYISGGSHVFSGRNHWVPHAANHCAR
jgi:hypothetical protein